MIDNRPMVDALRSYMSMQRFPALAGPCKLTILKGSTPDAYSWSIDYHQGGTPDQAAELTMAMEAFVEGWRALEEHIEVRNSPPGRDTLSR
jgi:hypothetical protein